MKRFQFHDWALLGMSIGLLIIILLAMNRLNEPESLNSTCPPMMKEGQECVAKVGQETITGNILWLDKDEMRKYNSKVEQCRIANGEF